MTERANSEMACDPRIRKSARLGALPGTGASRGRRPRAPASLRPRSPGPAVPSLRSAPRAMSGVPPNRIPPPAPPPRSPGPHPSGVCPVLGAGGRGRGWETNKQQKIPPFFYALLPPPRKKKKKNKEYDLFFSCCWGFAADPGDVRTSFLAKVVLGGTLSLEPGRDE